jgi:hypothetical protein
LLVANPHFIGGSNPLVSWKSPAIVQYSGGKISRGVKIKGVPRISAFVAMKLIVGMLIISDLPRFFLAAWSLATVSLVALQQ